MHYLHLLLTWHAGAMGKLEIFSTIEMFRHSLRNTGTHAGHFENALWSDMLASDNLLK